MKQPKYFVVRFGNEVKLINDDDLPTMTSADELDPHVYIRACDSMIVMKGIPIDISRCPDVFHCQKLGKKEYIITFIGYSNSVMLEKQRYTVPSEFKIERVETPNSLYALIRPPRPYSLNQNDEIKLWKEVAFIMLKKHDSFAEVIRECHEEFFISKR